MCAATAEAEGAMHTTTAPQDILTIRAVIAPLSCAMAADMQSSHPNLSCMS